MLAFKAVFTALVISSLVASTGAASLDSDAARKADQFHAQLSPALCYVPEDALVVMDQYMVRFHYTEGTERILAEASKTAQQLQLAEEKERFWATVLLGLARAPYATALFTMLEGALLHSQEPLAVIPIGSTVYIWAYHTYGEDAYVAHMIAYIPPRALHAEVYSRSNHCVAPVQKVVELIDRKCASSTSSVSDAMRAPQCYKPRDFPCNCIQPLGGGCVDGECNGAGQGKLMQAECSSHSCCDVATAESGESTAVHDTANEYFRLGFGRGEFRGAVFQEFGGGRCVRMCGVTEAFPGEGWFSVRASISAEAVSSSSQSSVAHSFTQHAGASAKVKKIFGLRGKMRWSTDRSSSSSRDELYYFWGHDWKRYTVSFPGYNEAPLDEAFEKRVRALPTTTSDLSKDSERRARYASFFEDFGMYFVTAVVKGGSVHAHRTLVSGKESQSAVHDGKASFKMTKKIGAAAEYKSDEQGDSSYEMEDASVSAIGGYSAVPLTLSAMKDDALAQFAREIESFPAVVEASVKPLHSLLAGRKCITSKQLTALESATAFFAARELCQQDGPVLLTHLDGVEVYQSSQHAHFLPEFALRHTNVECSHTQREPKPQWRVVLPADAHIHRIEFRSCRQHDDPHKRLRNFNVRILNAWKEEVLVSQRFKEYTPNAVQQVVNMPGEGVVGREVIVEMDATDAHRELLLERFSIYGCVLS